MLMALSNWEALVMETRLALVNLERVLDKVSGNLDVAIGLQRSVIHVERNIQLSRTPCLDSRRRLRALDTELKYLSVVEAFADKAPQRLSQIIRSLHKLVGEMERVPKRATSAFMVSTDAEVTMLKVTVEEVKEVIFGASARLTLPSF